MKNKIRILPFIVFSFLLLVMAGISSIAEPWSANQLMAPSELNKILNNSKAKQPIIYSIGYQDLIKNSIDVGPGGEAETQKKIKKMLKKVPKDASIVIYCGCCPFDRCPNVRPIFNILNSMGFKNHKLLNLPRNLKVDWIDKGYAIKK